LPVLWLSAFLALIWTVPAAAQNITRTYYIAAREIIWDYAPSWPNNPVTGGKFTGRERQFTDGSRRDRIGHRYKKAVYREYTDASFTTQKQRPDKWRHLGLLGPVIRASVGDTIRVVFKNMLPNRVASIHVHGLLYAKDAEGVQYNDGSHGPDKDDDTVPPGGTYTYVWQVPPRSGPGPADPSSIMWLYHSGDNVTASINAGLVGPVIITRQFQAESDGSPADVDREFVTLFSVFDENASFLAGKNRKALAPEAKPSDPAFLRSNRKYTINGYQYGNLPDLTMKVGERIRWYVASVGSDGEVHTAHWHGNTVTAYGRHTDTVALLPGSSRAVTMEADNPGTWLLHCLVNGHSDRGEEALYTVEK